MPRVIDITGQRFGRLVAVKFVGKTNDAEALWLCRCDCGANKVIRSKKLRQGSTVSCGCGKLDGHLRRTHGAAKSGFETPEYRTWKAMLDRCRRPKNKNFEYYGGRGIVVCERWSSFDNFLADMGPRPSGHTIERINNDGNYEPSNCKWIPFGDQRKNRRK